MKIYSLIILLLFAQFLFSCSDTIKLYNLKNELVVIETIKPNYTVMVNSSMCKDCLEDLAKKLNSTKKNYILVFPIEDYNNMGKALYSSFYEKLGVKKSKIYWMETEIYEKYFKKQYAPFLLINHKEMEIMPYQEIFDNNGKVKPGVIT